MNSAIAKLIRFLIPVGILVLGGFLYSKFSQKPKETKEQKQKKSITIKTKVETLHVVDFTTKIQTRGIVRAHNVVNLTPRVAGTIQETLETFETGAYFDKGDILIQLDDTDFHTAVLSSEAQVARTKATLAFEETRAKQAKLNWEDLGFDEDPNELVLRLPQLREAQANVDSALAQLEQARRNLERTKIRAPFNGRVLERAVGIGQSVGPGTRLGTIFAIDYSEIDLPLSEKDLEFIELPETQGDPPLEVELKDAIHKNDKTWKAKIIRTKGALDPSSLELFAIARIEDPFGQNSDSPPLRVGQPVIASIQGTVLKQVVVIPRSAVRQHNRILLVDAKDLTLSERRIKPIWSDDTHFVVRDETITDGIYLATTPLPWAPLGSKVTIKEETEETKSEKVYMPHKRRRKYPH